MSLKLKIGNLFYLQVPVVGDGIQSLKNEYTKQNERTKKVVKTSKTNGIVCRGWIKR